MTIKIVRSWPSRMPNPDYGRPQDRHPHVVDTLPKLEMDHDYRQPLLDLGRDVVILEWDIAVDRSDLLAFRSLAETAPLWPLVAPYKLHRPSTGKVGERYAHRVWDSELSGFRPIRHAEPFCQLFGLGMAYLPIRLVREFDEDSPGGLPLDDNTFSLWCYAKYARITTVHWRIPVVHLNYHIRDYENE